MASKAGEGERTEGAWRVSLPKTVGAPRAQERTKLADGNRSEQLSNICLDMDMSGSRDTPGRLGQVWRLGPEKPPPRSSRRQASPPQTSVIVWLGCAAKAASHTGVYRYAYGKYERISCAVIVR